MVPLIKREYAPLGSDRRHEIALVAGKAGGTAKARNRAKA
jgi:hypothetical protein